MNWCTTCGEWAYAKHTCGPRWLVWCPADGQDVDSARTVFARHPDTAAENWARIDDVQSAQYRIVRGNNVVVSVLDFDRKGPVASYEVVGESVPEYRAVAIDATASTMPPPTEPSGELTREAP